MATTRKNRPKGRFFENYFKLNILEIILNMHRGKDQLMEGRDVSEYESMNI